MGIARLLAKGWVLVCLFAGAHALRMAILGGGEPFLVVPWVVVSVLLFAAMGLLFVGGYGASAGIQRFHDFRLKSLTQPHLVPGFNEAVFVGFVVLSFLNQIVLAPHPVSVSVAKAFEAAIAFAVPGHHALVDALNRCNLNGGREFASAFTWLLAVVFACSAVSRLKLAAGLIRIRRALRPEALGPTTVAAVLGVAAIVGIQCFFVGTFTAFLPCGALAGIPGAVLIGLAPLLLAYLIFAALAALMASGSEK
jgi:hypothetical protein